MSCPVGFRCLLVRVQLTSSALLLRIRNSLALQQQSPPAPGCSPAGQGVCKAGAALHLPPTRPRRAPPPPAPPPPPGPQHSLPQGPVGIARPDLHGETEAALPAGVPPRLGAPRAPERPSAPMSLRPGEGRGEEELGRICSLSTKELISLGK